MSSLSIGKCIPLPSTVGVGTMAESSRFGVKRTICVRWVCTWASTFPIRRHGGLA